MSILPLNVTEKSCKMRCSKFNLNWVGRVLVHRILEIYDGRK